MKCRRVIVFLCYLLLILNVTPYLRAGAGSKTVLVHYMPWYSSKPVSGHWGWHWTMNRFSPDRILKDGQRELASHDYPLLGPYDSNDPHALECHVLLMKLAGIDGVVIDWYGIEDFRDYATIHRNTQHLIKYIKKAGLQFAIAYEDHTVKHMVEGKLLNKLEDAAHGKQVLTWLDNNWFGDEAYLKVDGRPILLVFGPQYFIEKQQWDNMMSGLSNRPLLYSLPHRSKKVGADGAFGWPPVSGGRDVVPAVWRKYLRSLYARGKSGESIISVAFPGFHDIYDEAGLHKSYGSIDERDGKTFGETLDLAWKSNSRLIQIATWNDYGEGTVIEPTRRFGYRYLEMVQRQIKAHSQVTAEFASENLRLPVVLYDLKKKYIGNTAAMADLTKATTSLFSVKCDEARSTLQIYVK